MNDNSPPAPLAAHYSQDAEGAFAGRHVVCDLYGCAGLKHAILSALIKRMAKAAGATLLKVSSHTFPGGGGTCLGLLAESHISIHTWPETGFVAADIFMCGDADPNPAVQILVNEMTPMRQAIHGIRRGGE